MGQARRYEGVTDYGMGQPYVEYRCGRGLPRFVVQKSPVQAWWYLFKVWRDKSGKVETLDTGSKKRLVDEARRLAQAEGRII